MPWSTPMDLIRTHSMSSWNVIILANSRRPDIASQKYDNIYLLLPSASGMCRALVVFAYLLFRHQKKLRRSSHDLGDHYYRSGPIFPQGQ